MRRAARTLQSGNAALFLLIRKMTTDKVLAALRGAGGAVMRSSFDETNEEPCRQRWRACGRQLQNPEVELPTRLLCQRFTGTHQWRPQPRRRPLCCPVGCQTT